MLIFATNFITTRIEKLFTHTRVYITHWSGVPAGHALYICDYKYGNVIKSLQSILHNTLYK